MEESFEYTSENAETYKILGIESTSYEASYLESKKMLGDLSGKIVLDFGSGTGRSAKFLKELGADKVVGVDHNKTMVDQARREGFEGINFILIDKKIPLLDKSIDKVFASQVFTEMGEKDSINVAMKEIARVLKPAGEFILIVANPESYGHNFVSYYYPDTDGRFKLKSGDKVRCIIKGERPLVIDDHFWTEDDYIENLESAGFKIKEMVYPKPNSGNWLDETKVAPDIVIRVEKQQ